MTLASWPSVSWNSRTLLHRLRVKWHLGYGVRHTNGHQLLQTHVFSASFTTLHTAVCNDISTRRFQFVASKKQVILRGQVEIPAHTILIDKAFCPFRYAKPRTLHAPIWTHQRLFPSWFNNLTIRFSTPAGNDWESLASVTRRRAKREDGYSYDKERF
jgi:hypothetical protein